MSFLLDIQNLNISFPEKNGGKTPVLSDVSFSMEKGEILGLIGESGSGKTMTALAIADLLPAEAVVESGKILFHGQDLRTEEKKQRRQRLGREITMIFQEPLSALDPIQPIHKQLKEIYKAHRRQKHISLEEALTNVGFSNPDEILRAYPHQLSGGQRQRVLIAGSLLLYPDLLIADESTTALDTITQQQILSLLKDLSAKYHIGILFISHNLLLVRDFCHRVLLFDHDKITDAGNPDQILQKHLAPEEIDFNDRIYDFFTHRKFKDPVLPEQNPILELKNISAGYTLSLQSKEKDNDLILKNICFSLYPGEIKGVVGVSGGGKTTLARIITGLLPAQNGEIYLDGKLHASFHHGKTDRQISRQKKSGRLSIGMIFQDPYQSLHPYMKIGRLLEEPLRADKTKTKITRREAGEAVLHRLEEVGLSAHYLDFYPFQLSGGQRQRVSIALNLMRSPSILVADEPLSSVDLPTQLQLLQLLEKLQKKHGFSLLLISHDLHVVKALCQSICVIEDGRIVEDANTKDVFLHPAQDTTKKLLRANPWLDE